MSNKLTKSKVVIISIFALITLSFFYTSPRFVSGAASNSVNIDIQLIGYTNDTIEGIALCSVAGNFDNDEFLDIAVGSSNGKVYVIENSTKGFVKSWDSGNDFNGKTIHVIKSADIDKDTVPELVIGVADKRVYVYECTGDNDYTRRWGSAELAGVPKTLAIGDADGDLKNSIIIGTDPAVVYVFERTGSEENNYTNTWETESGGLIEKFIQENAILPPLSQSNAITGLAIGDMDGDGSKSIVVGTRDKFLHVFEKIADNTFVKVFSENWTCVKGILSLDVGTTDNDTIQEIVVGTSNGKVHNFKYLGALNYYLPNWNSTNMLPTLYKASKVCIGDFFGQGDNSIALLTNYKQKLRIINHTYYLKNTYEEVWALKDRYNAATEGTKRTFTYTVNDLQVVNVDGDITSELVLASNDNAYVFSCNFTDTDADGLSDLGESVLYGTDPLLADTDGDGLTDYAEIYTYNLDPLVADSDSDWINDGMEVGIGTDPKDSASNILLWIFMPIIIVAIVVIIIVAVIQYRSREKAKYNALKDMEGLDEKVKRLIFMRIKGFFDGKDIKTLQDLKGVARGIDEKLRSSILDKFFNFIAYLRLKGVLLSDEQEELVRTYAFDESKPMRGSLRSFLKENLGKKYLTAEFPGQLEKIFAEYAHWTGGSKTEGAKAKAAIALRKCPKCGALNPEDSVYCLDCGERAK